VPFRLYFRPNRQCRREEDKNQLGANVDHSRYTTGPFGISSGALPDAVSNVRIAAQDKTSTVTWSPVAGTTSYVVLFEWMVYNSEVGAPLPVYITREVVGGSSSSFTYGRKLTRAAVVAVTGGTIASSAKQFTALNRVNDVSA
jgi:hypothetical protein